MEPSRIPPTSTSVLNQFRLEKILDNDPLQRRIVLLGTLPFIEPTAGQTETSEEARSQCIVTVQKAHFREASEDLLRSIGRLEVIERNDIYSEALAWRSAGESPEEPDYKLSFIMNATPVHIAKKTRQAKYLIRETPEIYRQIVLPHIKSIPPSRIQWVYNILSHVTESEKILYEDPAPEDGFVILPDFKWDLKSASMLYLVTLVHTRSIKSLRDLRKSHIPLLKNIRRKAASVAQEKWGLGRDSLKMYVHYQPSYYHFHVHVVALELDGFPGMSVGHAHLVDDLISLLETEPEGVLDRMTLSYSIVDMHPLAQALKGSQAALEW